MLAIGYVSLLIVLLAKNVAGNCLVTKYCGVGRCCSAFGVCGTGTQYCGGGGSSHLGWSSPPYIDNDCRIVGCRPGLCCSSYGRCGSVATYCATVSYSNCGTKSCGVGLCCTRFGYCDRVGASCAYKKSSTQSQPVSLEGKFKGQATYYNETKVGTQYSTCGVERRLSLDESNQKVYGAALNQAQFDPYTVRGIPSSNPICQKKALVKGPKGEIVVRFIDRCPDCKGNDIALTREAFIEVAGELGIGQTFVEWYFM
ncbi:unnamed protein product [Rotaria sordida]|uniref:Chitin-binding type-1 domain-containing protein n=1 Tax=Rotaria sordida TaxID=392033 RepID=A0A815TBB8_9BILA|nr:unnamed protein product [Rotaria sordida]CAF1502736.1 unnamed protein product [Rotaria sordida]CAF1655825.1 unnamed protein product [Rotaria sordida]CAF3961159.1 unnamed protein product [Rotaria sordida]